jgi:hypothetical protein
MPNTVVTLSSVGTSTPAALNWRGGKPTTIVVASSGAGSSAAFTVEFTLTDIQLSSSPTWFGVSSNPYAIDTTAATTFGASLGYVYIPFGVPIAAARINCSSNSGGAILTMFTLQGEAW